MADVRRIDLEDGELLGVLAYLTVEEMVVIVRVMGKLVPSTDATSDLYQEFDSLFNRFYEHGVEEVVTDFNVLPSKIEWKADTNVC